MTNFPWEAISAFTGTALVIGAIVAWLVRSTVSSEVSKVRNEFLTFKDELLRTLNGKYAYSVLCSERHVQIERRLESLEERHGHVS